MPPPSAATIRLARRIEGRLRVPGDKSISHRCALLAAMADGRSELHGYAPGADCRSTLTCLRGLGVEVIEDTDTIAVVGRGLGQLRSPDALLDAGNSGTTMRLLAGLVAGHPFSATIVGDASLSRRPMRRVLVPLTQMGARTESADGRPPLTIHGTALRAIAHATEVPSAQVKSAVLLAGLLAEGTTSVVEAAPTRDHTERALEAFGAKVTRSASSVALAGGQRLKGRSVSIPGDFSSAAYWMAAAAAFPGSRVQIDELGLNPTRTAFLEVLRRFGARVQAEVTRIDAGEPRGTVIVEGDRITDLAIEPAEVPGLIDELPAIAALAAGGAEISVRGAAELRVKESDRIAVLVAGLRALGLQAEERPDGFVAGGLRGSGGPARGLRGGGVADACGDHRMAMALAVAALAGRQPSTIEGADAVAISYPGFFEMLDRLIV
jgi:3-phosphoshikimate 1-carboxyvinyltransferase